MLRWKRKLQSVWSNEPDEFEMFMNPGMADENDEPAGGGAADDSNDPVEPQNEEDGDGPDEGTANDEFDESVDDTTADIDADTSDKDEGEEENPIITALKKQNEELMGLVRQLSKKDEPEPEPEPEPINPLESESFDALVKSFGWDEDEAGKFKSFFKAYADSVINSSVSKAQEITPSIVNNTMTKQQKLTKAREDFFNEHTALKPIKAYVATIASEVAKEDKSLGLKEILAEAAKRSYEAMGITPTQASKDKGNVDASAGRGKKPAFPKAAGTRSPAKKKNKLQADIEAMLALDS